MCCADNTRYMRVYRAYGPQTAPTAIRGARQLRLPMERAHGPDGL